jgi:hypothetical protein
VPISRSLADPALRSGVGCGLGGPADPDARPVAEFLAGAFGASTAAVIHYGSRARRVDVRPESAHDFFVIVDRYRDAYRALASTVGARFSPRTATLLARVLPPNVISVAVPAQPPWAKCAVLTVRDLVHLCSPRANDHFTQGRLFQQVAVVWSRDPANREAVTEALMAARIGTFRWVRPYLPAAFTVEDYCRALLETSFAAEIRPESGDRVAGLLAAQQPVLLGAYGALLRALARDEVLSFDGNTYRQTPPPHPLESLRVRLYFRRSKVRATLRWLKFVALYDDWLGYIIAKIERRSGVVVELTTRERRWPLIFLWPRVIRYVRSRPQRRAAR